MNGNTSGKYSKLFKSLSIVMVALMLLAPISSFADEWDIANGDILVNGGETQTVVQGSAEAVPDAAPVITGTSETNTVTLDASAGDVNVTFEDLSITSSDADVPVLVIGNTSSSGETENLGENSDQVSGDVQITFEGDSTIKTTGSVPVQNISEESNPVTDAEEESGDGTNTTAYMYPTDAIHCQEVNNVTLVGKDDASLTVSSQGVGIQSIADDPTLTISNLDLDIDTGNNTAILVYSMYNDGEKTTLVIDHSDVNVGDATISASQNETQAVINITDSSVVAGQIYCSCCAANSEGSTLIQVDDSNIQLSNSIGLYGIKTSKLTLSNSTVKMGNGNRGITAVAVDSVINLNNSDIHIGQVAENYYPVRAATPVAIEKKSTSANIILNGCYVETPAQTTILNMNLPNVIPLGDKEVNTAVVVGTDGKPVTSLDIAKTPPAPTPSDIKPVPNAEDVINIKGIDGSNLKYTQEILGSKLTLTVDQKGDNASLPLNKSDIQSLVAQGIQQICIVINGIKTTINLNDILDLLNNNNSAVITFKGTTATLNIDGADYSTLLDVIKQTS